MIYQVAGLCMEKTTIIISPLIALMNQQNAEMRAKGISTVSFSGMDYKKQFALITDMANGVMPQYIFTSPERISSDGYLEYALNKRRDDIGLVVVDEAHCISQWGDGFRPAYRNIPDFLDRIFGGDGWPATLCLTATLNEEQQQQVIKDFHISNVVKGENLWRKNLYLEILNLKDGKEDTKDEELERIIEKHRGEKILVFAHRVYGKHPTTRTLYDKYKDVYEGVAYFDSKADDKYKAYVLEGFKNGDIKIVFATSAFGMGVDIPDIRVVVNYLISETVEQYYQEVGRGGRDNQPAYGYLLYTNQSKRGRRMLLNQSLCTEADLVSLYEDRKPKGDVAFGHAYDFWKDKLRVNTRLLSGDDTRCVMDVLCPYFHAVPKLGTTINESEHIYIRLTNQQIALLDFLVKQDTAVIHGLAGTGKTVLAIEKAKMLAAQGESVLFLCYNSFLRDSLRENNTIPGVVFHNAHSLAYEIMGATDSKIDDVLAEFEEYLEVVFDKENWKYKNVIVDEGQDLDDRLLNRLYDLSKSKKGSFYVFYDKNQFIMKKRQPHWLEDAECRLVLSKNCRNTAEIFKTACSIIGKENLTLNEIHGEVPFLRFYSTEKEMTAIVEGFLERMKKGEVPADKITILSASTLDNSFIDAKRKYAGFELSEKREPGKVHFTTIRKFKGLEAEAILVVDASMIGLKSEEDRRLLYVGVSRAKNYLEIAMNQDIADSELGDYLHALNPNRSLPRNKKGLKRLLNVDI